jgi:spermidine/putrescine transport system ATP-binding protein
VTTPAVEIRGLVKAFGDHGQDDHVRAVDRVDLTIADGEFFALLGPSGCGKTTTLRVIAGFEEPDEGEVRLAGRPLRGVPPFHRPVNTVFQDYALFPHMTVEQNVAFGLRMARVPRDEIRSRVDEALALVRLGGSGRRRPEQLSGGQRQRVALARALVNQPRVLLLDEPLGALDLKLRKAMQVELKELQQRVGITFVYVTHDQEEALTMADRIAVMNDGRVLQVGGPAEIYDAPVDRFVADFIGESNFLDGVVEEVGATVGRLRLPGGSLLAGVPRADGLSSGDPALLAVRPEKLSLRPAAAAPDPDEGEQRLRAIVRDVQYLGTDTRYQLASDDGAIVVRVQNRRVGRAEAYRLGDEVRVSWRADDAGLLR